MHTPIMHNAPKRNGPPLPCMARQRSQIWTTRSTSRRTAGSKVVRGQRFLTFIGIAERSADNPECTSMITARATARAEGSEGHKPTDGWHSAICSQIANLSQMVTPSSCGHRGRGPCQWESAAGAPTGWPRSQRQQVPRRWYQSPLLRARDGMLATPGGTSSSKRGCR